MDCFTCSPRGFSAQVLWYKLQLARSRKLDDLVYAGVSREIEVVFSREVTDVRQRLCKLKVSSGYSLGHKPAAKPVPASVRAHALLWRGEADEDGWIDRRDLLPVGVRELLPPILDVPA